MARRFYGWHIHLGSRPYEAALEWQVRMVRYRRTGIIRDTLFYMEHPDVVTIGRDEPEGEAARLTDVEVFRISRGGGFTFHGPGQLVIYPVFDLDRRGRDLHQFIRDIEEGIIRTFGAYGLSCRRHEKHTGVWVENRKIASIGIAVEHWISFHGAAVNLTTDLSKFKMINPCGLTPDVMTSAQKELGRDISQLDFAGKLSEAYADIFDTAFNEISLDELAEMVQAEESSQSL